MIGAVNMTRDPGESSDPRASQPLRRPERTIPKISPLLWNWFARYSTGFVKKHFHAVRLSGHVPPVPPAGVPLIICLNHPSWWDPLLCILLARRFWSGRKHYGPIDARMLSRYRFFGKLGFFGVEPGSTRGGAQFLRGAANILSQPASALWLTAEGEFADVRRRPVCLRPGLAHLLRRLPEAVVVPMALEYTFWGERTAEVLVHLGKPIETAGREHTAERWNAMLTTRLQGAMDELAELSMSRDPARFQTILGGASGSSPVYDGWRWLKARCSGKTFSAEHLSGAPEIGQACERGD